MNYRVKEKKNFALALLSVMGLSVDVRDVEELELDGYNRQELQAILEDLQTKLAALRRQEPAKGGAMYQRWDDAVFCLAEIITVGNTCNITAATDHLSCKSCCNTA